MVDKSFAFFLKRINFTQKNEAKNIPKSQERLAVLAVKMQCLELKKKKKKKPHQFWLKENLLVFVKSLNCKIYLEK